MLRFESDAEELIYNYYTSSRRQKADPEGFSIRQLQSIIRLAIARAKMDMAQSVTRQHVNDIIKLLTCTTYAPHDASKRALPQRGIKKPSKADRISEFLARFGGKGNSLTVDEMRQHYDRSDMPFFSFDCFVDMLCESGLVIKASNKSYRLI